MKKDFAKAFKIYKYLSLVFAFGFLTFLIIDDWSLLIYNIDSWYIAILIWLAWIVIYGITVSLIYWGIATAVIVIKYSSKK